VPCLLANRCQSAEAMYGHESFRPHRHAALCWLRMRNGRLTAIQSTRSAPSRLGRVLPQPQAANMVVGTKVLLPSEQFGRLADAVATSLESSLARLSRDCVDIFHLHNAITEAGGGDTLTIRQLPDEVVPAFERLRQQGKTQFFGLTAIGDTTALKRVIDAGAFDSAQVVYNMLNPSAATELPPVILHRTMDGCSIIRRRPAWEWSASASWPAALSGSAERHPIASPPPEPIGSAMSYDADVARAGRLLPLVKEGFATSLLKPPRGLRSRIRRWGPSWSAWQRHGSSRKRSLLSKRAPCHPPRSTASQGCNGLRW
jgi:hypothetical protein